MERYYLSVDGGGTKTELLLARDDGSVVYKERCGPASVKSVGEPPPGRIWRKDCPPSGGRRALDRRRWPTVCSVSLAATRRGMRRS